MAQSQKHRSVLFDFLAPQVGEDTAEALMAEFPAKEGDELATKSFLRAELADLRTDLATVRSDLTTRMVGITAVATAILVAFGR